MRLTPKLATLVSRVIIPLALASLAVTAEVAQAEIVVREAPPPARVEMVPSSRPGFVWDGGHWQWRGRGYEWVPGHWQPVRVGAHWVPGHWGPRGPNWIWHPGHWAR